MNEALQLGCTMLLLKGEKGHFTRCLERGGPVAQAVCSRHAPGSVALQAT